MATASSRSLQLGARRCCAAAASTTKAFSTPSSTRFTQATRPATIVSTATTAPTTVVRTRCFSSTSRHPAKDNAEQPKEDLEPWELEMLKREQQSEISRTFAQMMPPRADGQPENLNPRDRLAGERALAEMWQELDSAERTTPKSRDQFWNDDESDLEMVVKGVPEEDNPGYDMSSMAHARLDEIREQRNLARVIAWEMPLLAKFAKPFVPPGAEQPLRFRYTSYMGEFHPAEKKVVVEFCPADLGLMPVQQDKLRKLVGPRYNPEKDIVRMSCEKFEHQAQNKRYLGDLVNKLVVEAKDPTDTFEDVPLDTRHHKFKYKPKFPREWRMTEERKAELVALRAQSFQLDQKMTAEGTLIDGVQRLQEAHALNAPAEPAKVPEMVRLRR